MNCCWISLFELLVVAATISFQLLETEADLTTEEKQIVLDLFNYFRAENSRNQLVGLFLNDYTTKKWLQNGKFSLAPAVVI